MKSDADIAVLREALKKELKRLERMCGYQIEIEKIIVLRELAILDWVLIS